MFKGDRAELGKADKFPYIATTYRLTEHFHFWTKTDLATGELMWEQVERRDWDTKQQLIIADGLFFALTKDKELVMAEANKAGYKELGRVRHGLEIHHTQQPTLANGRLYIRGLDTVAYYQLTDALLESTPDLGSSVKPQELKTQ